MRDVASSAAMLDRLALLFVITCSACRPSAAAPARTTNPTVATPPKPTSSATTEISIDAITCDPQVPAWERALAEGYAWDLLHPGDFDGIHAARRRASAAIDALQQDDPRYIEAHCRAGFAHHNLMNVGVADKHFRRALEVLRRRGITDAEASYATAGATAQPDNKLHDTALSGLINAHDHALRRADLRPDARAWRVAELDVALQCRALFRHRVGSEGPAKADLQALASLRASTR